MQARACAAERRYSVTRGFAWLRSARWTASAVPHAPPPRTATLAVMTRGRIRLLSETEDLREPDEARLTVAVANFQPAGRRRRRGRQRRLRHFQQYVGIGAKHERRAVVRGGAYVGAGRPHDDHALAGQRLRLHPADRAARVTYLGPALHAHERLQRDVATVNVERFGARRRRVVEHGRGVAGRAEIGGGRTVRQRQRDQERSWSEQRGADARQLAAAGTMPA